MAHKDKVKPKTKAAKKRKVKKVLGEFKSGTLKTRAGKKVTSPKQAIAISLSEAGESKKKSTKRKRK